MLDDVVCPECAEREKVVGCEVCGVYDGVLYWQCRTCGRSWPRFTVENSLYGPDRLVDLSARYADEANTRRIARGEA